MALDRDIAAIASNARAEQNQASAPGGVYIYYRSSNSSEAWVLEKRILSPSLEHGSRFGQRLKIVDDLLFVSSVWDETSCCPNGRRGAVYIYQKDLGGPDNWGLVKRLVGPDGSLNSSFGGLCDR